MTGNEKKVVLSVLHEERFIDLAPSEVYATLLDEGTYHCSERSMSCWRRTRKSASAARS
jgi:hypothetical protein